ncbi:3'-5' exonuclease [Stenotrophomonas maltophilia]|uniref:3'-5' exonuclease n=1 Tax=Stenotrophomonas maltophilia TaxID=40324 RepID=UPI000D0ADBFF|nr:3'-5' exonuclease [Stenotrophomonas maltophilia]AVO31006.1 hypothetical protein C6Y55_14280 [Stenotrophomonas maltophilia]
MRGQALALLLLAASSASAAVPDGVAPAFLVPVIGGKAKADPLTFWQQGGQWFAEPATWREVGLQLPPGQTEPMSAQALGVGFVVDEATATVALDLPADRLKAQRVARDRTERGPIAPPAPGVLVNYSVAGMVSEQQQALSLGHEVRKAGRWGVISTSGQVNTDTAGTGYVRGVTRWQKDDPNRLVTYQAGDVFAGPSSSLVNLGGVRVAKDPRALDPLTPTYPVPVLGGVALDPATVEVLANRARVLQGRVGKGPFTADGSALGTGAQQTQVVVRDPYGRETVVSDQRFYVAPTLLRQGLTTWEVAAGRVRQGESDYGTLGATGSVARGLNDRWTLRGTAQTSTDGKANVALGATTALGTYGTLDLELGTSTRGGQRQAVAYDYRGPRFGVRLEHERQQDYWRLRAPGAVEVEQRTRGSVFWRPTPQWSLRAGFAGADLAIMSGFQMSHPHAAIRHLSQTFRCPQSLCDLTSEFVSRNPMQLVKKVFTRNPLKGPRVSVVALPTVEDIPGRLKSNIQSLYDKLPEPTDGKPLRSMLVLGRYRNDKPKELEAWRQRFGDKIDLRFLTIHRAKGLEADFVALLNVVQDTLGFPSQVQDDPILQLAMPEPEMFEFGEERRLFYVALTRAKRSVVVYTTQHQPSQFLVELQADHGVEIVRTEGEPAEACPVCGQGVLVERVNRATKEVFHSCSRFPRCPPTKED